MKTKNTGRKPSFFLILAWVIFVLSLTLSVVAIWVF